MGSEWITYPSVLLGQVAKITMGQSPPGSSYNECGDGFPFYQGAADFGEKYPLRRVYCNAPKRFAEKGDILLSVRAPIGRINIAIEKCAIGRGLAAIRGQTEFDTSYIEFFLRASFYMWSALENQGSVFGNAKKEDLERQKILWPEQSIRCAIAHILGTLDDKIELNRRMNETLEEMARALFKSWFVDFEPVRAKINGRWRKGQSLPGLPAHLYDLFPDSFVDSELGEIPKGWRHLTFEEILVAKQGEYLPRNEISDFPSDQFMFPVWGGNGIRGFTKRKMYDYPVIVMTCRGSNCGLIFRTESPSWISNIAFACEPKLGTTNFLYIYLSNCSFSDCISGSAQPQITYSNLKNKQLPFPVSPEICNKYSKIIDPIFQKISNNNYLSRTLAALRDTLLPKLISGELRVKEAEKFLKERGL